MGNPRYVLEGLKKDHSLVRYLPDILAEDIEFMLSAIKANPGVIVGMHGDCIDVCGHYHDDPSPLLDNAEFMKRVVELHPQFMSALCFCKKTCKYDHAFHPIMDDVAEMRKAVTISGVAYDFASERCCEDLQVAVAAVSCYPDIIQDVPDSLIRREKFWLQLWCALGLPEWPCALKNHMPFKLKRKLQLFCDVKPAKK